ncbi:aspartic peptidase A1 [Metarhizium brunneum]
MKKHGRNSLTAVGMAVLAKLPDTLASLNLPITDMFTHGAVNIDIGLPDTQYTLLFDPGSSNTWIGAQKAYVITSSSQETSDSVAVTYGSGSFSGLEYNDILTISGADFNQSIGVANTTTGVTEVDGLLGLGPTDLTLGTLTPDKSKTIPTVPDNLFSQGHAESATVTIVKQAITFGSTSLTNVTYAPITEVAVAKTFWGFDASVAYGDSSLLSTKAGIIDHGSTATLLSTSSFNNLLNLTGATVDDNTGLPVLSSCSVLDPIVLTLAGVNITIPVDIYRWPADNNTAIGGDKNKCYLAISNIGTSFENLSQRPDLQFRKSSFSGNQADEDNVSFILGYNTLKHFGVVLDKENSLIGMTSQVIEAR